MIDPGRIASAIARNRGVPGGAVAVASDSGEVHTAVFGVADPVSGAPVTEAHLFEVGSISKVATALTVLRLAEQGLLRLEQPVSELLPGLPGGLQGPELTLERLMNHTAGLISSLDALPDEAGQVAGYPGEPSGIGTFHYSNVGYLLLGLVVARVAGRPFPEVVRELVLEPAGMHATLARVTYADRHALATGTTRTADDRPWLPGDPVRPAPFLEVAGADGNLAAPIADLVLLGRLLLAEGAPVVGPQSFARMTASLAPAGEDVLEIPGAPQPEWSRYGLGINVEQTPGGIVLSHGGGMVGYASFLHVDLATRRIVAVATNADGDSPVAEAIARSVAAGVEDPQDPADWSTRDLSSLVGEFVSDEQRPRTLVVSAAGGGLTVTLDGAVAALLRGWGDRVGTRHPVLAGFHLTPCPEGWAWGGTVFRREPESPAPAPTAEQRACVGHYRAYDPWFPDFRVVLRSGQLVLIASGGVEAPSSDTPLEPLGDGVYRVGDDPGLPERLVFAPPVDGLSPWVERDGCRYSRAFTP